MKHKTNLIKSAKARVTGTIPYCHGKIPLELCPFELKNFPKYTSEAACQRNSSETTEQNFINLVGSKDTICSCSYYQEIWIS
jgi:hypothetical protein